MLKIEYEQGHILSFHSQQTNQNLQRYDLTFNWNAKHTKFRKQFN